MVVADQFCLWLYAAAWCVPVRSSHHTFHSVVAPWPPSLSQVYYYPSFHAGRDGPKLAAELQRNLTRPTAWEAVMRIRCSRGLKISSFHGHFFNRRCVLMHLHLLVCMLCCA